MVAETGDESPQIREQVAHAKVGALEQAQHDLVDNLDKFMATPISKMKGAQFVVGMALTHATAMFIGSQPEDLWIWHALIGIGLFPLKIYRAFRLEKHAFLVEFCFVTNLAIWICMLLVLWDQMFGGLHDIFGDQVRARMFRCMCAFCGPLVGSVFIYPQANAFVPHSIDEMEGLLIHLSPVLSMYFLRWFNSRDDWLDQFFGPNPLRDVDFLRNSLDTSPVGFFEYMKWPLCWVIMYTSFHATILLYMGIANDVEHPKDWQRMTSFSAEVSKAKGNSSNPLPGPSFAEMIGKIGEKDGDIRFLGGNEAVRFLKYEFIADLRLLCLMGITYPWFRCPYHCVHVSILLLIIARVLWNGAEFFWRKFDHIEHSLDGELNRARKEERKAHNIVEAEKQKAEKKGK